jgi:hypothetical protein
MFYVHSNLVKNNVTLFFNQSTRKVIVGCVFTITFFYVIYKCVNDVCMCLCYQLGLCDDIVLCEIPVTI